LKYSNQYNNKMSKRPILLSNKPSSYNLSGPILIQNNHEREINMFVSNLPSNITEVVLISFILLNLI